MRIGGPTLPTLVRTQLLIGHGISLRAQGRNHGRDVIDLQAEMLDGIARVYFNRRLFENFDKRLIAEIEVEPKLLPVPEKSEVLGQAESGAIEVFTLLQISRSETEVGNLFDQAHAVRIARRAGHHQVLRHVGLAIPDKLRDVQGEMKPAPGPILDRRILRLPDAT